METHEEYMWSVTTDQIREYADIMRRRGWTYTEIIDNYGWRQHTDGSHTSNVILKFQRVVK